MSLDPGCARLLRMLASIPAGQGPPSAEARRQGLRQLAELTADPVDPAVAAEDIVYDREGPKGPLALRLYRPSEAADGLIVYLHGGGWVAGDLETHDGVCRALARSSGCAMMAVDYRRPPEHPFPAAVDDAIDAVLWASTQGFDPTRIVLAGDSAGGHIAATAVNDLQGRVALLLLLCPILELEPTTSSRAEFAEGYFISPVQLAQDMGDYLQGAVPASASPPRADLTGHPPTHLHLAEYDPFRDEGLAYAERLRAAGIAADTRLHPGMIHYFYALPRTIPYARTALAQIGEQVRDFLRGAGRP